MEYNLINGCFSDEAAIFRLLSLTLIVFTPAVAAANFL